MSLWRAPVLLKYQLLVEPWEITSLLADFDPEVTGSVTKFLTAGIYLKHQNE